MRRVTVLVNGLPGAGKSTLAGPLAAELGLPLLAKDAVKEALFETLGVGDRQWSRRLGAAAGEVLWSVLASCPAGAVVESWLSPTTREIVRAGLRRAGVCAPLEVWCDVPPELALGRFAGRGGERHAGHLQATVVANEAGRWVSESEPLGLGPLLRVPTNRPVDVGPIAEWVRAQRATT